MTPEYPRGGDPRRLHRLHHQLYFLPRVSRRLDEQLDVVRPEIGPEGVDWRASHADLGVRERDVAGGRWAA